MKYNNHKILKNAPRDEVRHTPTTSQEAPQRTVLTDAMIDVILQQRLTTIDKREQSNG